MHAPGVDRALWPVERRVSFAWPLELLEPEDALPLLAACERSEDGDDLGVPVARCVPVTQEKRTQRRNPEWFKRAMEKWSGVAIDLVANRQNAQLPYYASEEPGGGTKPYWQYGQQQEQIYLPDPLTRGSECLQEAIVQRVDEPREWFEDQLSFLQGQQALQQEQVDLDVPGDTGGTDVESRRFQGVRRQCQQPRPYSVSDSVEDDGPKVSIRFERVEVPGKKRKAPRSL
ncbi:hypothetical protein SARC_06992 [Sphaeroforma arctica JP610]|uniref:Uncharacterized protein n=1 Tax=Sphaeroforma arctica JP610 TaxID=667725 RepID=A0A0L0FXI3_9EUKA|nr:hypothetical protein SARC_06992 [Sphaeroforma arctica JP610]KNC80653.1 hypothetical protein SARC_06992 [Sphaeroforma arctica JP610]|eukprot:XP_014154555.1 hypothetical protein SARC_06992 [Sphaeroforma arctica JP610]